MNRAFIDQQTLYDIADAIRDKRRNSTLYKPGQMAAAIRQIHGDPILQEKSATKNGPVTPDTGFDGLSKVTVNVPNTYRSSDEGKVVQNSELVPQTDRTITANGRYNTTTNKQVVVNVDDNPTLVDKSIDANGIYDPASDDADGFAQVTVSVPNTYDASDEGKVVDDGALVAQTGKNISTNGTHDTTTNNQVVVNVPNSYSAADEGKVVDDGELVAQTPLSVDENGTYDTTLNNQVVVDVPTVEPVIEPLSVTQNGVYPVPSGVDGFAPVTVNVSGGGSATLITKDISENGIYNASDDEADGYFSVNVNVNPILRFQTSVEVDNVHPLWEDVMALFTIPEFATNAYGGVI